MEKFVSAGNPALVSVVIPCYNQAGFLEEAVQSVHNSTYTDIEIIIINDGSVDNTELNGKALADKFDNVFYYSQKNSGPSVARNYGITNAKGIYILPLDADDLISKDYIAEAVKIFETDHRMKVVYCEAEKIGEKTGKWNLRPFSLESLAKDNMIFVSALYKKADWVKCGGYPEDLRWVGEDWVFWIAMLKTGGKVFRLPFVGFYYRISSKSRRKGMTKSKKKYLINYINLHHKEFEYQQLNGPLRFQRSHSKEYNNVLRFLGLLNS
jgi:glycosyltransferase involved in cell wall biosynthesis